jgi:hypothetical protein
MKRTLLIIAALCVAAAPAVAKSKNGSAFGVTITSCVVNASGDKTNGINAVYYNTHDSPATEIDFLVTYQKHKYILIDRGSFTRGAQINHNLTNSLTGQPWAGPAPKGCAVQRVYLANGNVLQ